MNSFDENHEDFLFFPDEEQDIADAFSDLQSVQSLWRFCDSIPVSELNNTAYLKKQKLFHLRKVEIESLSFSMFTPEIPYFNFPNQNKSLSESFLTFVVVKVFKNQDKKKRPIILTPLQIQKKIAKKSSIELIVSRFLSYLNLPLHKVKEKINSISISPKKSQNHLPIASHWDIKYASLEFSKDKDLEKLLITSCVFHF